MSEKCLRLMQQPKEKKNKRSDINVICLHSFNIIYLFIQEVRSTCILGKRLLQENTCTLTKRTFMHVSHVFDIPITDNITMYCLLFVQTAVMNAFYLQIMT